MENEPPEAAESPSVSLDALLTRKTALPRRIFRAISVVVLLLVSSGLILHQYLTTRPAIPPTPATPQLGVVTVIERNTSWGTLTFDGYRLTGPAPQAVTIRGGQNTISLNAPPFARRTCHVAAAIVNGSPTSVVLDGPCTSAQLIAGTKPSPIQKDARAVVAFTLGGNDLPSHLATTARQAIADDLATLQRRASVPVGDYYALRRDAQERVISERATSPLIDIIDISPDFRPDPSTPTCGTPDCGAAFSPGNTIDGQIWSVKVDARLEWRFFADSGSQIGEATYGPIAQLAMSLAYTSADGWRVVTTTDAFASNLDLPTDWCGAGQDLLVAYEESVQIGSVKVFGAGPVGCAFAEFNQNGTPAGFFVWRYGVLLAADATAHRLVPALPIAPPAEIAEAMGTQP